MGPRRTPSDWLRVACIGCGGHASRAILPALRHADVRLVATCDLDAGLAERAAVRFGAPRWYTDSAPMLDEQTLDAVVVVGPPALHVAAAVEALEHGLHVFVEKPPGLTIDDACSMREAARRADRRLMVGFMKRHALAYRQAHAFASGIEGPRLLRLNYSHWRYSPLREHLAFMSTHALDLVRFLMGDVRGGSVAKTRAGDQHAVALLLEHDRGTSLVSLSALEPRVQERVEISGDSMLLTVDDLTEVRLHRRAPGFAEAIATDTSMTGLWRPDTTIPIDQSDSLVLQGYAGELAHFADAVLRGDAVSPDIDDGVEAMRLLEAIVAAPEGRSELQLR